MNKSILLFLFFLLALVACRSGKTVTQLSNKKTGKEKNVEISESLIKSMLDSEYNVRNVTTANSNTNYEISDSVLKKKLLTDGSAYDGMRKYVIIKNLPEKVLKYFPDIVVFSYNGILGQEDGNKDIGAILGDRRIKLPDGYNKLLTNRTDFISYKEQIELIFTLLSYPFKSCEIKVIHSEQWQDENGTWYSHKATGIYDGIDCDFDIYIQDKKIQRVNLIENKKIKLGVLLYEN